MIVYSAPDVICMLYYSNMAAFFPVELMSMDFDVLIVRAGNS